MNMYITVAPKEKKIIAKEGSTTIDIHHGWRSHLKDAYRSFGH
jgi:hypothetical protein